MPSLPNVTANPLAIPAAPSPIYAGQGVAAIGQATEAISAVSERIQDARARATASASSSSTSSRLQTLADEVDADPNFDGREQRWAEESRTIIDEGRKATPFFYRPHYDTAVNEVGSHLLLQVRRGIRKAGIDEAVAKGDESVNARLNDVARAQTRELREEHLAAIDTEYDQQALQGLRSREEVVQLKEKARAEGLVTAGQRMIREDPWHAEQYIRDPSSEFAKSLPEKNRQDLIDASKSEQARLASAARAQISFDEARAKERERQISNDTGIEGQQLLNARQLTPQWVEENRYALGPTKYRQFSKALEGGGQWKPGTGYDPTYYASVVRESVQEPSKFASRELDFEKLGPRYDEVVGMQAKALVPKLSGFEEPKAKAVRRSHEIGLTKGSEVEGEFFRAYQDRIAEFTERNAKEPDDPQLNSILDGLTFEVSQPSSFLGFGFTNKTEKFRGSGYHFGGLTDEKLESVMDALEDSGSKITAESVKEFSDQIGDIPPEDAYQAIRALREKGIRPTAATIRRLYDRRQELKGMSLLKQVEP